MQHYNFLPCDFSCPNKNQPVECSAGSYAATGSIKCQPCPKGAFCPMKGLPTYHLCANGTYSDIEGLSDCKICEAGFRCPSVGMEAPEECPNGTYSHSAGARYCVLCPEGHRWGYRLIINLFWVFNTQYILGTDINWLSSSSSRHNFINWYNQLAVSQALYIYHLVIKTSHQYILFDLLICSSWLSQRQATHIIWINQLSVFVLHLIHCCRLDITLMPWI